MVMHSCVHILNCVIKFYRRYSAFYLTPVCEATECKISRIVRKAESSPGKSKKNSLERKLRKFIRPWHSESFLLTVKSIFVLQFCLASRKCFYFDDAETFEGKFVLHECKSELHAHHQQHHYTQTCRNVWRFSHVSW